MLKRFCTAKISNAVVTKATVKYEGSLGIDSAILKAAGIRPYEMALIANCTNTKRFETYLIPEPEGSGAVCLYGGAAHMGQPGDELILMITAFLEPAEAAVFEGPKVVKLAPGNRLPQV
jgi:aspartate 1-decarboxylase